MAWPTILHPDDDDNDVFFVRHVLSLHHPDLLLHNARDGQEAIEYLAGVLHFADRATFPFPDLVILDLHLPLVDGFGVLSWIRRQCIDVPVLVLTSSPLQQDRSTAARLRANAYLVKEPRFRDLPQHISKFLPPHVKAQPPPRRK